MRSARNLRGVAALAGVLAILVGFATPGPAAAGEYTIYACQADEAGYVSSAFADFATRGMKWRRACNPLGPGLRGLVSANVPGIGRVARGAQSGFALEAATVAEHVADRLHKESTDDEGYLNPRPPAATWACRAGVSTNSPAPVC